MPEQVVYLMHNPDARRHTHKIGIAADAEFRLRDLIVALPSIVLLGLREGGAAEERRLHSALSEYATAGEWFDLPDHIVASIGFEPIDSFYESRPHLVRRSALTKTTERKRAYRRTYYEKPENRERRRAYHKAYSKQWYARPETKEKQRAYYQRPEVRQRLKENAARRVERERKRSRCQRYYQDNKAKWVERAQRPDVRAKKRENDARYRARPEAQEKQREHNRAYQQRQRAISSVATWFA